jgi:hypothetical protein
VLICQGDCVAVARGGIDDRDRHAVGIKLDGEVVVVPDHH